MQVGHSCPHCRRGGAQSRPGRQPSMKAAGRVQPASPCGVRLGRPPPTSRRASTCSSLRGSDSKGTSPISVVTRSTSRMRWRMRSARSAARAVRRRVSTTHLERRVLAEAALARPDRDHAADLRRRRPPTISRMALGKTLTPRTISMSSVRPMQRTRGAVRPQAQRPVATRTWSRLRKRSSGTASWARWV